MRRRLPLLAFLAASSAYWAALIAVQSGVVAGKRYFALFDDAMISMRYARNVARGWGAVFNAGERVEGFTNPLWVAMMALVHLVVRDHALTSLAVQIVSALCLMATVVLAGRLAALLSSGSALARWSTMVLCATYYPLNFWSLHGMEVGALALLATLAAVQAVEAAQEGTFRAAPILVLSVAMLVRADAAILAVALAGALFLACERGRARGILIAGAAIAASAGLQTAARLAYYGVPVPNTYFLKMSGISPLLRAHYGLRVFAQYAQSIDFVPLLLPLLAPLLRRSRALLPPLALVLAQAAYSVWVGGDSWETPVIGSNRFLTTVAPIALSLLALACHDGVRWIGAHLESKPRWFPGSALAIALIAATGALANDAFDRAHLRLMLALDRDRDAAGSQFFVQQALALDAIAGPTARVAVTNAGTVPYFLDRYTIDILGKMDPRIARLPMHAVQSPDAWWPGHMKYDQAWSIGVLAPDVVVQCWRDEHGILALLERDYDFDPRTRAWLRRGSPHLRR